MIASDASLVRKCQQGRLEAFTKIYDRYFERIYRFVYYKTCHRESAEDLTSQTFMKALEKIDTFDSSKGKLLSWLMKIAANNVVDHFRREKGDLDIDDVWDISDQSDLEEDYISHELNEGLREVLRKLPGPKRDIVIMRIWQNLSYREIAEVMSMSEASCKMSFYRSCAEMRQQLPVLLLLLYLLVLAGTYQTIHMNPGVM